MLDVVTKSSFWPAFKDFKYRLRSVYYQIIAHATFALRIEIKKFHLVRRFCISSLCAAMNRPRCPRDVPHEESTRFFF